MTEEVLDQFGMNESNIKYIIQKLKSLCQNTQFCGICLANDENLWTIDTEFDIVMNNNSHKKLIKDIVYYVFKGDAKNILASPFICSHCSQNVIQCYLFIYNTIKSSEILNKYIEDLSIKITDLNNQLTSDGECENSNVLIVLQENEDIDKYVDIRAVTEVVAIESSSNNIENAETNTIYENNKKSDAIKVNIIQEIKLGSQLKKRKLKRLKNRIYKCMKCKRVISTTKKWLQHERVCQISRRTEKIQPLQCKICYEVLKTKRLLSLHYKIHNKARCRLCFNIMPEENFLEHLKLNHEDDIYECEVCDRILYSSLALETHMKKKHGDPQCIMCLKHFKEADLKVHKCKYGCLDCREVPCMHYKYLVSYREQMMNEATKIMCLDCDYICPKREALLGHVNREHLDHHPFTCAHCSQQFYSKVTLRNHLNRFHRENFMCQFCDLDFKIKATFDEHVEICKWIKRQYKCDVCTSSFHTEEQLSNHKNTKHAVGVYPCNLCNKQFYTILKLKEHMFRIHNGIQLKRRRTNLECPMCGIKFDAKKELMHHIATHGPDARFPCKICNVDFDDIKKLHAHSRMHCDDVIKCTDCNKHITTAFFPQHMIYCNVNKNTDSQYECETCGKTLQTESMLKLHRQAHLEPVECPICRKLIKPIYLKRHLKYTHTQKRVKPKKNLKVVKCDWCGHMVTRKGELESHVNRFHLKIKPYECNMCKKTFCGKERLKEHIQTHSTQNTRYCTICGKKYANSVCLKMHQRIHSGVTPYECDVCGEKFRSSSIMNTHKIKKHTEKTIRCPLCDTMFYLAREMRNHFKKVHWKNKDKKFDPRDVKELGKEYYYLFEDKRQPKVDENELVLY
ncbi:zinc finger protein 59-like [Achroia grisella]|uniref:zinc finger protein 59-like n=1 Tax=Achroia grisella TaxID=688607 RepID=UPI0027D34230|nr:zinc finger protein 59-like [Achroia grisella]XP_059054500.1 zinc finger protein 59-like [Achroia grisella]